MSTNVGSLLLFHTSTCLFSIFSHLCDCNFTLLKSLKCIFKFQVYRIKKVSCHGCEFDSTNFDSEYSGFDLKVFWNYTTNVPSWISKTEFLCPYVGHKKVLELSLTGRLFLQRFFADYHSKLSSFMVLVRSYYVFHLEIYHFKRLLASLWLIFRQKSDSQQFD